MQPMANLVPIELKNLVFDIKVSILTFFFGMFDAIIGR